MKKEIDFDVQILTSEIMKQLNVPVVTKSKKKAKNIDDASLSRLISNVKVKDLIIDLTYQRKPNATKVAKIIHNFDPNALGVLVCSMREDGIVAVIDGGHRVAALNAMGLSNLDVKCLVFFDLSIKDEAEMFTTLNDNRTKPKTQDIFKSKVIAGDSDASAISAILNKFGLSISNGPAMNAVRAMGTITNIYKREGKENLENTILSLSSAFDKHSSSFSDMSLIAVSRIFAKYGNNVDKKRLIESLSTFGNVNLWSNKGSVISKAMGYKDVNIGMSICLVNEYNKRLRTNRLDVKEIS